jgi:hypothetical protein
MSCPTLPSAHGFSLQAPSPQDASGSEPPQPESIPEGGARSYSSAAHVRRVSARESSPVPGGGRGHWSVQQDSYTGEVGEVKQESKGRSQSS